MYGNCNRCGNRCALGEARCERGYEEYRNEADFRPGEAGHFRTLPAFPEGGGGPGRHGRGGRPPHGGRPPFGRPQRPVPDADGLRERIASAGLAELVELAGRLIRRGPGMGSARGQSLILSILAGRDSISQRELQQMLGVQPGSVSEIVSKLERKGLVTRERGEDRRGNRLSITDAGRQAIPRRADDPEDELFSALDAQQREALAELLRTLLNDWASKAEAAPGVIPERPPMPEGRFMTLEARAPEQERGTRI